MKAAKSKESVANEIQIQNTIAAYNMKCYYIINKTAHTFEIFYLTMKNYLFKTFLQVQARKTQQNLSNAKKKNLIQWITQFTIIEFPVYPKLMLKITEEIYQKCTFFAFQISSKLLKLCSISHN